MPQSLWLLPIAGLPGLLTAGSVRRDKLPGRRPMTVAPASGWMKFAVKPPFKPSVSSMCVAVDRLATPSTPNGVAISLETVAPVPSLSRLLWKFPVHANTFNTVRLLNEQAGMLVAVLVAGLTACAGAARAAIAAIDRAENLALQFMGVFRRCR